MTSEATKSAVLTEEQLAAIKNDVALSLHSWVRDVTCARFHSRRRAVLNLLESVINAAVGSDLAYLSGKDRTFDEPEAPRKTQLH